MDMKQCILCGAKTPNKGRMCDKCNEALQETFEENINNKTKRRGFRYPTKISDKQ